MPAKHVVEQRHATQSHIGIESVRMQAVDAEPAAQSLLCVKNRVKSHTLMYMPTIWAVLSVLKLSDMWSARMTSSHKVAGRWLCILQSATSQDPK